MTRLMAWAPKGLETVGAVVVPAGTILLPQTYLDKLGWRVRKMAMEADPLEMAQASDLLMQAGLLETALDDPDQAAAMLIWENLEMQTHLQEMGVPGPVLDEGQILSSDPAAEQAIRSTTLPMWAMEVACNRADRY